MEELIPRMEQYFREEIAGSRLFIFCGVFFLSIGLYLYLKFPSPAWQACAVPLVLIALIQLITGFTIFFRTEKQLKSLKNQLETAPGQFFKMESNRMAKVNYNFKQYHTIEILLFIAGVVMALAGSVGHAGVIWMGSGIGLSIQCGTMLVLDLFAEWRSGLYEHEILKFGKRNGWV